MMLIKVLTVFSALAAIAFADDSCTKLTYTPYPNDRPTYTLTQSNSDIDYVAYSLDPTTIPECNSGNPNQYWYCSASVTFNYMYDPKQDKQHREVYWSFTSGTRLVMAVYYNDQQHTREDYELKGREHCWDQFAHRGGKIARIVVQERDD